MQTQQTLLTILTVLLSFFSTSHDAMADDAPETLTEVSISRLEATFTGDYDALVKDRRIIRVLIPHSRTFFFFDGAKPRGISYEAVMQFEKFINEKNKTGNLKIHALVIPTARENLIPYLRDGKGDIAIGNLTITPERLKDVDFSDPFATGVDEIVVSAPGVPALTSLFDLSGKQVHARKSSSYYESLRRLNSTLEAAGKKQVKIISADDNLEDEDLLEMLNAGVIGYMVIDNHKALFWEKILDKIKLYPNIRLRTEGTIGWAVRKNNPKLKTVINEFVKDHKSGTLMGNILLNKYFKSTSYITDSVYNEHLQRFKIMAGYFKKYGSDYGFDYLMLAALGYQESQLDNSVKSSRGAVGVMQVLPSTAKDKNIGIPNIQEVDANIHAGTKYLRFMTDRYFAGEGIDRLNRTLFAFASYNAGPAKISKLRRDTEKMGLDPNKWFNNVEIAAAQEIGRETVQYVSNIFKYYIAYKLIEDKMADDGPVHLSGQSKKKKN
jgi:membrane-bound lytic murein transglycosylase MltF